MEYLYDKLLNYSKTDYYAFHMPGHKRNSGIMQCSLPYDLDITEIDGFDDLHHAKGILKQAEMRAAQLYHSQETCFLINGSTAGILSAILGCTSKGDRILVARNCHKSVYHGIYMNELEAVYLYPQFYNDMELNGPIDVLSVEQALEEYEDVKAVVITSPTYDGVLSDVEAIAERAHKKGIPLIVDEAHGAHFGLHPYFPENANAKGADVVIHSLHKTLPSLTQTALIHMNGDLVNRRCIRKYLHMIQTSSPSYILMASMDECIRMLLENRQECFQKYVDLLEMTRKRLKSLKHLRLLETDQYDKSKLVISVKGTDMTSRALHDILLKKYHLQMEMTAGSYVLAMTSVGDTYEGMQRLAEALEEIDAGISFSRDLTTGNLPRLEKKYSSARLDLILRKKEGISTASLPWKESVGYLSTEYAYIYPPGIPLIVPGEKISEEAAILLCNYDAMGFSIEGLGQEGRIEVLING